MASLTDQALTVATKRYFLKDSNGDVIEDIDKLFERVANAIAEPEKSYGKLDVERKLVASDFKDMLSNFISGIMIFIYEPFKLGDTIHVDGKTGKVVDINLRYVTLVNEESKILVPNSLSVSKSLEVVSENKSDTSL